MMDESLYFRNIFGVTFVVVAWFVPLLVEKMSIRWVCMMAGSVMTIGAWLRFAATYTTNALDTRAEHMAGYSLLLIGSLIISISQPLLIILGPAFSELYFSPKTRLTATMIIAISNPIGQAVASFLAPTLVPEKATMSDFNMLLLVVASATTVISLVSLGIGNGPPSPASAISELPRHSAWSGFKVLKHKEFNHQDHSQLNPFYQTQPRIPTSTSLNCKNASNLFDSFSIVENHNHEALTRRDRIDFFLLTWLFGTLRPLPTYTILIEQIYSPYGFNSDQAGYFGIASIIPGLMSAGISSPILDRFLRRSKGLIIKVLGPLLGLTYFGLIWIPKSKNLGAIYVFNIGIGIFSFISLPVALELGADITHKAMTPDSSAAILYLVGNALSVIFLIVMDALRSALIFQGVMTISASFCILALKAKQRRPDL
ncbi:major facilitator superfamily domain-containing protein [Melampsora americana]|nr:major facilitator superfamily domain-containing protein [Melampsora americana]